MPVITRPGPTVRQLSGSLNSETILSVLAKRTYRFDPRGRCGLAPEQLPLQGDVLLEDGSDEVIAVDTDLTPWKPLSDIVVLGHGHSRQPLPEFTVGIRVGGHAKTVVAVGPRRATLNAAGHPVFSAPEPITKLPLSFRLAYGGRDHVAERRYGIPGAEFAHFLEVSDVGNLSPYLYPRNPCGRGYLVELSAAAVETLELPQLEDPKDRLTAAHLAAGHPGRWTEMPVPQSLGWFGYAWFPRASYLGVVPQHETLTRPLFEVQQGWAPPGILDARPIELAFDMRACNGASLGLQVPHLKGDEEVRLSNLCPAHAEAHFVLPRERPKIFADGRKGKLNETTPVIHAVIFEPDESRLSIVWRGSAPALRSYADEELAQMPLRVEWA